MTALPTTRTMYQALVRKDSAYEGVFFVGVRTTGIFCRPTCSARKPRPENVDYYPTASSALAAGYRACMKCRPLDQPGKPPDWLTKLRDAIDRDPSVRLRDQDLRNRGIEPAAARRQFKRHFGMTFHAYARARRVGAALGTLRRGRTMTQVQMVAGYESESGFREACRKLLGDTPTAGARVLPARWLTTPLGPMLALADDEGLHALEYIDRRGLERQLLRLRKSLKAAIVPGEHEYLDAIEKEMAAYFAGAGTLGHAGKRKGKALSVPLTPRGSEFQKRVWDELRRIPLGMTMSYGELAKAIGRPTASRAVARANGDNFIAIVIPCHRVIGADGSPTGYGGGIWRKMWLLEHEKKMVGEGGLFGG